MPFRIKSTLYKISRLGFLPVLIFSCMASAASVSVNSNMSFGLIEFTSSHQGEVLLGSNGSVTLTGSGLFYQGGAIPGQVTIIGDSGIIEFRCSDTSTLGGDENGTLEITGIEASVGAGTGSGSGTACAGVSLSSPNPIVLDLGANPNPKIFFGGTLNIPFGAISDSQTYESNNGSGAPLSVSAVFQ